jgi:hypothetical protein
MIARDRCVRLKVNAVSAASVLATVALLLAAVSSDPLKAPTTPATGGPPPFNPTGATEFIDVNGQLLDVNSDGCH